MTDTVAKIRAAYADSQRRQSDGDSPLPDWAELPLELREAMIHLFYAGVRHGAEEAEAQRKRIDQMTKDLRGSHDAG
jgi:hypothetical protein